METKSHLSPQTPGLLPNGTLCIFQENNYNTSFIFLIKKNFFLNKIYLFIFGCFGSSLLHTAFSSCGERGLLSVVVHGLLAAVASLVAEHGL